MDIQELIHICEGKSRKTGAAKFGSPGPIYTFCTENIGGYLATLAGSGGTRALTLCSSGDHALNLAWLGFREIHCFDLNLLSKFWLDLKTAALDSLSRGDFLKFLSKGKR